jgi:hypothetical protein
LTILQLSYRIDYKENTFWLERIWSFAFGLGCRDQYQKRITLLFEGITIVVYIQEGTRAWNPPSIARNHSKKSPHLFKRHLVFMNITPRKKEGLIIIHLLIKREGCFTPLKVGDHNTRFLSLLRSRYITTFSFSTL